MTGSESPAAQEHVLGQDDGKPRLVKGFSELSRAFPLSVLHEQALAIRDDVDFWQRAESLVIAALDDFAHYAANGKMLLRKLFVDDAVRGLAFVDLCPGAPGFDVALMNPPFGEAAKPSKSYLERAYPRTKNDVYAAFVERLLGLLCPGGTLGAITSRTGFYLSSFQKWREDIILKEASPTVFADLGYGVLDTAMVETAAYCLVKSA